MKKQKIRAIAICAIVLVLSNLLLIGGGLIYKIISPMDANGQLLCDIMAEVIFAMAMMIALVLSAVYVLAVVGTFTYLGTMSSLDRTVMLQRLFR